MGFFVSYILDLMFESFILFLEITKFAIVLDIMYALPLILDEG